ncbi:MAG TPA: bifunctional diaminohydroxyphosphoribosylaminopyrimidine deaminase/5-amino-6-(5-phosphoribosylamino)uracil reductase RibD [Verrucomicrobiae bacterium]|nr:bifunctional diaminohydroxyphosphoribosylaminopyrimidine deaminase/5-amino-6-(5-phosphoribosylamino)uracil reductase RibD [Verrucomicrobiae bacterium]
MHGHIAKDEAWMRLALRLAARAEGETSPNPMVGAVLVRRGRKIGQGWHRRAGQPHAEIEALQDARARHESPYGATLYVTLEPCCTHGRTPPCTNAIVDAGIRRVVVAAMDPNPAHAGRGFRLLRRAEIAVETGILADQATRLNEAFNHWIVHRTPYVAVKAAMTLDGKIATATGESQWITSPLARTAGMRFRRQSDAILVGVNTVLLDDPRLTVRPASGEKHPASRRRIIVDSQARTPVTAQVVQDRFANSTTIVTTRRAPFRRVAALSRHVQVWSAPERNGHVDLRWLLRKLGSENVTRLLVEGGGEINASFLLGGLAHEIAFFFAPKILGGRDARRAVAGDGIQKLAEVTELERVEWRKIGPDLMLQARIKSPRGRRGKRAA